MVEDDLIAIVDTESLAVGTLPGNVFVQVHKKGVRINIRDALMLENGSVADQVFSDTADCMLAHAAAAAVLWLLRRLPLHLPLLLFRVVCVCGGVVTASLLQTVAGK